MMAGWDNPMREFERLRVENAGLRAEVARLRESLTTEKRDEFAAERRETIIEALSWWEDSEGRWGYERARDVLAAHEAEWCGATEDGSLKEEPDHSKCRAIGEWYGVPAYAWGEQG